MTNRTRSNDSIYFSLRPLKKYGRAFNIVLGARGVGKTFSSIYEEWEDLCKDREEVTEKFLYMRRKQTVIDMIAKGDSDVNLSPFKSINQKKGTRLESYKVNKQVYGITDDPESMRNVGYMMGLTTVANVRGFDGIDIVDWIYDEFVPETIEKRIPNEGEAILNAYETINRNRELDGKDPLRAFFLSNTDDISHDFFVVLGLIPTLEKMQKKGIAFLDFPERSLTITMVRNIAFQEEKAKTALYKLTKGTKFSEMALNNQFAHNDFSLIASRNLREYNPLAIYGDVCIYRHKSRLEYYCSSHLIECKKYGTTVQENARFYRDIGRELYGAFINSQIFFESYREKKIVLDIIN